MKRYLLFVWIFVLSVTLSVYGSEVTQQKIIYFFYIDGCGDCHEVKELLQIIKLDDVRVEFLDVRQSENDFLRERFDIAYKVPQYSRGLVPALFIGGDYLGSSITAESIQTSLAHYDLTVYAEKMSQIFWRGQSFLELLAYFWRELIQKGKSILMVQLAAVNLLIFMLIRARHKVTGFIWYLIGGVIGIFWGNTCSVDFYARIMPFLVCANISVLGLFFVELYRGRLELLGLNRIFSSVAFISVMATVLGMIPSLMAMDTELWHSFQSESYGLLLLLIFFGVQLLSVLCGGIIFGCWQMNWFKKQWVTQIAKFVHMVIQVFFITVFVLEYLD